MRSPLLAAGALLNVLTLPPLLWLGRVPPDGTTCAPAPAEDRAAWVSGLGPIAFAAACATALILVWASSLGGAQRPRAVHTAGAALAVALGAHWWAVGGDSFVIFFAIASIWLIYPVAPVAAGFYGWLLWAAVKHRPVLAWQLVRALCWCALVVLIPWFAALIGSWGDGGLCLSTTALPVLGGS